MKENKMREIEIEKITINCGGLGEKLDRSVKLLEKITVNRKIARMKSTKRIPAFGISPNKESGCKVTIRDKEQINNLLKRFFATIDNKINEKSVVENQVSIGIHEYIEVPGLEYDREIGILGFEVSITFKRKGKRVKFKKHKKGKYPKRQNVKKAEIIEFLNKKFNVGVSKK
jgi:large subunit ribosomal protein L5